MLSCVSQRVLERVAKVHFYFRRTEPVILKSVICDEGTQPVRSANNPSFPRSPGTVFTRPSHTSPRAQTSSASPGA